MYQKNKAKHYYFFLNTFLVSFLSSANCFVVTTRHQNFMSEHDGYKGAET